MTPTQLADLTNLHRFYTQQRGEKAYVGAHFPAGKGNVESCSVSDITHLSIPGPNSSVKKSCAENK